MFASVLTWQYSLPHREGGQTMWEATPSMRPVDTGPYLLLSTWGCTVRGARVNVFLIARIQNKTMKNGHSYNVFKGIVFAPKCVFKIFDLSGFDL